MKELTLIRGLPGVGKTTVGWGLREAFLQSHEGASCEDVLHCEADDYFERPNGAYVFVPTQTEAAHRLCVGRVTEAMRRGVACIIVSNSFTQRWELRPYRQLAATYDYAVRVITVEMPHASNGELAERSKRHGVGRSTIARMRDRFEPFGEDV